MCNRDLQIYQDYDIHKKNDDYYFIPKLGLKAEASFLEVHNDEYLMNQVELNIEKGSNALLELINIRSDYANDDFTMTAYDSIPKSTKKALSRKVLNYVRKHGQIGFLFHILYDYVKPSISLASDYAIPTIQNPFCFYILDTENKANQLKLFGIENLIDQNELLATFFPTFKSDIESTNLSNSIGVKIDHLEFCVVVYKTPLIMNQYCEPLKYYVAAIELLYSIISDNKNALSFINESITKDGEYFVNNAKITLKYDNKEKQYVTLMSFKSLFDFYIFIILQSKSDNGILIKCCDYKYCNKIIKLSGRSDQKYCDDSCKEKQRDYLRKENRRKKRETKANSTSE